MAFPKSGLPSLSFRININLLSLVYGVSLVGGADCWTDCSAGGKETELWGGKQWTGLKKRVSFVSNFGLNDVKIKLA